MKTWRIVGEFERGAINVRDDHTRNERITKPFGHLYKSYNASERWQSVSRGLEWFVLLQEFSWSQFDSHSRGIRL